MQRFHRKQDQLATELIMDSLFRKQDRILYLVWGDNPLIYDRPRFGALETQLANQLRGGWYVALARDLKDADSHVLDWVLWREALLSLLLPHLRHIPEAADLGLYAGLRYGNYTESEYKAFTKIWKQVSPPQHYQHYIYDAPLGFPLFDQVVAGSFLHRALHWLNTIRPTSTGTPLATSTYTAALERWMLETHTPLTSSELRILLTLKHITTLHQSKLAKQLQMTPSALSQALNKLAQRHLLRLYHFINLPLIGLTPHEVILQIPSQKKCQQISSFFSEICYTWLINLIQDNLLHCRVLIPNNQRMTFNDWLEDLVVQEKISILMNVRSSEIINNWNLSSYIPEIGWPQDFSVILEKSRTILSEEIPVEEIPKTYSLEFSYNLLQSTQKFPVQLNPEDFIYFRRDHRIILSTDRVAAQPSLEARYAGLADSAHMKFRRQIKKLEKNNVSKLQGLILYHVGLDTVIQIYIFEPREITIQVLQSLHILPNISGVILENGNGYVFLYVPNHNAVDVLSTLQKIFSNQEINVAFQVKPTWQAMTGFESPIQPKYYDFDAKKWVWTENTLPKIKSKKRRKNSF